MAERQRRTPPNSFRIIPYARAAAAVTGFERIPGFRDQREWYRERQPSSVSYSKEAVFFFPERMQGIKTWRNDHLS